MKVVSLLPQEKPKKVVKQITSAGLKLNVVESKQNIISYEFENIFKSISDEVLSLDLTKQLALICIYTSSCFESLNPILKTVDSILNGLFQSSGNKDGKLKLAKFTESGNAFDLIADKETNEIQPMDVKNSNECSDLANSVLSDLQLSNDYSLYVSIQTKTIVDIYFIPILSQSFSDLIQLSSKSSSNAFASQLKQSIDGSTNRVFDFRFGFNCPFDENKTLLLAVDQVKKAMSGVIPGLKIQVSSASYQSSTPSTRNTTTASPSSRSNASPSSKSVVSTASRASRASTRSTRTVQSQASQKSQGQVSQNRSQSQLSQNKSSVKGGGGKQTKPEKVPKWREFITRPVKGPDGKPKIVDNQKVTYIDRSRLVNMAQMYAYDPKAKRKDLEGLIQEIDNQIAECEEYHNGIGDIIVGLNDDVKIAREEEKRLTKKERDLRQHLMELKAYNKSDENAHDSIMIGSKEDYRIAYECLKEEVEALENELEFLRLAFPDINVIEEEEEEDINEQQQQQQGEEEEEEDKNESSQQQNVSNDDDHVNDDYPSQVAERQSAIQIDSNPNSIVDDHIEYYEEEEEEEEEERYEGENY